MQIGTNIKIIRIAKNISQKQLAYSLGITTNYLSMVENNQKKPSLTLLEKLAQVLQTPLQNIFAERLII